MRDPLHFVSVRHKLALLFVGLCLIAFGLGGYLVSSSAREALESEILDRLAIQCRAMAASLDAQMHTLSARAEDFASDGYIRQQAQVLVDGDRAHDRSGLELHLRQNKLPLAPAFASLTVVDPAGAVLASTLEQESRAVRLLDAAPWRDPQTRLGDLGPALADGVGPHVVLSTPVLHLSDRSLVGHLLVELRVESWVRAALSGAWGTDRADGQGARIALVDRTGRRAVVTRKGGSPSLDGGDAAPESRGWSPVLGTFLERFPITSTGWQVEVSLGADEALSPVSGLQSRYLGVGIGLALLCCALLFFPMRFLARPLVELERAARRMARGEVSTRVVVESSDEIGMLAQAFNHMAQAVEERTGRLESSAADLRQRTREFREQRDRLDTVIASLRDGLVVLDADGRRVLSNEAAAPLLNVLENLATDADAHGECGAVSAQTERGCAACLGDPKGRARSCLVDAGQRVLEVHTAPLPPDSSGRAGRVLVARDVTDRVARDEREIHQERLAVLGEVGAVMAHELNNPLASISMFNQMLAADLPDGSPLAENVEVIRRNVDTCKRTIRELLDYAASSSPELGLVNVHETLHDVTRFLRPVAERAGVVISRTTDAPNPQVQGDEVQLRQVFVNLVMNAIQAMPQGGRVELQTREGPSGLEVDVIDDGPGIPADQQELVFRPFFTTKSRGDGTGLGLPTARRITELQGGGLTLQSSAPGCTVFRVRLRARVPAGSAA